MRTQKSNETTKNLSDKSFDTAHKKLKCFESLSSRVASAGLKTIIKLSGKDSPIQYGTIRVANARFQLWITWD